MLKNLWNKIFIQEEKKSYEEELDINLTVKEFLIVQKVDKNNNYAFILDADTKEMIVLKEEENDRTN